MIVWLPPMVLRVDHGNDWPKYLDVIYGIFQRDFVHARPRFQGQRLGLKRLPLVDGREATFWHMVSKDSAQGKREVHEPRCERMPWPKPVIERPACGEIKIWTEIRQGGEGRIHLWVLSADYLVVLAKRKDYILPWTAFPVPEQRYKEKLQRRFERAQKS